MKFSNQSFPTPIHRSPFVFFGFLLLIVFSVHFAVSRTLANDFMELLAALAAIVGGILILAVLRNWRFGLYAGLGWLLFEDLVRKYLGNNMLIYFAKDVLLAAVYLSFFLAWRRKSVRVLRPPFLFPLLFFFWLALVQVFNPAATTIAYGLLGMKLYFYYVPLFFLGYALLDSEEELRHFLFVSLFLAVVIGGLGIAQSILGHTFLNPAVMEENIRGLGSLYRTAPLTHVRIYRPTSVFVSDGRFSEYMMLSWLLAFGVSGYLLLRTRRGRFLASIALAVISAALVQSGGRGPLLFTVGSALVCSAAFLWGAPWRQRQGIRVLRTLQRLLLIGGFAIFALIIFYPEAFYSRIAFYSETMSLDSPASEVVFRARDYPLKNFLAAFDHDDWLYGNGTGTVSLGGQYITRILGARPMGIGVENGYGNLVLEMGIMGLALWLFLGASIALSAWKVVRQLKASPWFPLAMVVFWFAFMMFFPLTYQGITLYQNFVVNAYLWLLLGLLFRLPEIARTAQIQAAANLFSVTPQARRSL